MLNSKITISNSNNQILGYILYDNKIVESNKDALERFIYTIMPNASDDFEYNDIITFSKFNDTDFDDDNVFNYLYDNATKIDNLYYVVVLNKQGTFEVIEFKDM